MNTNKQYTAPVTDIFTLSDADHLMGDLANSYGTHTDPGQSGE